MLRCDRENFTSFSRAVFRCDELSIDVDWDFVLVPRGMLCCDTPTIAKTKIPVSLQLFCDCGLSFVSLGPQNRRFTVFSRHNS